MYVLKLTPTLIFSLFLSTSVFAEPIDLGHLEKVVRAHEQAFANTMADRDFEAFKTFLSDDAVFWAGPGLLQGKQQVADAWELYFRDEQAPFSWKPEQVVVLESGSLAHSSGPVFDPEGKHVATFNSIWRFDEAAQKWMIVFDKGSEACDSPKP